MVNCKDCFVPVINVIIFITLTMILILNIFEMYKEQYRVDFLKMMLTNWKTSPATKIYIPTEPISNNDDSLINVGIFAGAEDGCRCINEKYNRKDGIITKYFYYNLTEKDASGNIKCNNKNSVMLNTSGGYIDRCPFLSNDNLCMIYEVRPEICKEFKCSSYCDVENTNMNYKNVRAINMLKTFYPDEYCPYNGIDLDLINQRLNNLSKQIYR